MKFIRSVYLLLSSGIWLGTIVIVTAHLLTNRSAVAPTAPLPQQAQERAETASLETATAPDALQAPATTPHPIPTAVTDDTPAAPEQTDGRDSADTGQSQSPSPRRLLLLPLLFASIAVLGLVYVLEHWHRHRVRHAVPEARHGKPKSNVSEKV